MCVNTRVVSVVTILCLLVTAASSSSATDELIIVQISDGPIQGAQYVSSWTNKTIYVFRGIPYASPPVGDLRFKPSVPPTKWNETKDCTSFGSPCMQASVPGCSEDCLFLNVYSPEYNPEGALAPVYIWIHGGSFEFGESDFYGPEKLVAEGVVVVTINYRLGAFGFLTLGTSEVPGNAALFDQILAMKWVQTEISNFGGDPNRVTLGGQSCGSMMTHLHYISPLSKGLFQAAIGESGTSLRVTAVENGTDYGVQLAELVNCSTADLSITQQCLRNLTADVILTAQYQVTPPKMVAVRSFSIPWVATIDKDTNKDNPFLPASPADLIDQGQGSAVPFLMGTNRDEGEVMLSFNVDEATLSGFAANMQYLIPSDVLSVLSNASIEEKIKEIKDRYFGGVAPYELTEANIFGYLNIYGDYSFFYPTSKSATLFHKRSTVFLYKFAFDGTFRSTWEEECEQQFNISFVGHGDELGYIFVCPLLTNQTSTDPESREMITWKRMVRLWTNFIKYRNPTPSADPLLQNVSWTPVQNNSLHYLEISDNLTMVQADYESQVVQFWDSIFSTNTASRAFTLLTPMLLLSILGLFLQ